MVGLVDIAPITSSVTIRGQDIMITGVSARGIALLLARFPELRAVMTGREVAQDVLWRLGGDVIAAIIAAGRRPWPAIIVPLASTRIGLVQPNSRMLAVI